MNGRIVVMGAGLGKNPRADFLVSDIIRVKKWLRSGPAYNVTEFDYFMKKFKISSNKIIQINHHLAHAASVFYTSGFKDSSILPG